MSKLLGEGGRGGGGGVGVFEGTPSLTILKT